MSIRDKSLSVVNALGDKYLQGDALDAFKALDPQSKYEMLCAVTTADPRYKTMSSKLKELTEEKSNEASEGWLSTIGRVLQEEMHGIIFLDIYLLWEQVYLLL